MNDEQWECEGNGWWKRELWISVKELSHIVRVVAKTITSTDSRWGEETSQMPRVKPSEMKERKLGTTTQKVKVIQLALKFHHTPREDIKLTVKRKWRGGIVHALDLKSWKLEN